MNVRTALLVSLVFLGLSGPAASDPAGDFEDGLRRYRENDMAGAIAAWEKVIAQGAISAPLYYNLGNAYYRAGQIGKAILCYERAHRFAPRDADVIANLDLARLAVVDKIDPPVRLVIWNWVDEVRDSLSMAELAGVSHVLGIVAALLTGVWLVGPSRLRAGFRMGAVVLLFGYVLCGAWYVWRSSLDVRTYGIVTAAKADAFSAPDASAKQLFSLHEGTKVRTRDSVMGWVQIRLVDGRNGWIPIQDMEKI